MRKCAAAACLLLLTSGARAQAAAPRFAAGPAASVEAAPLLIPGALMSPGLAVVSGVDAAAPAFVPASALSASPTAPAPAPAAVPMTAAAAGAAPAAERAKSPAAAHAVAALSEFSRLVADLVSGDAARSGAAADELIRLKDAHLNGNPEPRKAKVLDLKPMQIPAGMIEVQEKADELRGRDKKDAENWLLSKSVPIVEDSMGRMRPVDHHHEARAAWEAGFDEVYAHRYLDDKLHRLIKGLSREQFYAVTRAMGLFYDRDQFGVGPHDPNHLPEDVRGLADDPYRSLAGRKLRKLGGYDKTSVPFAEFRWAQFFRARLKTYPTRVDFAKAVAEAMRIVHDPAARDLPGYKPE